MSVTKANRSWKWMGQQTRHVMNDVTGARRVINAGVAGARYVEGTCCDVVQLSEQ